MLFYIEEGKLNLTFKKSFRFTLKTSLKIYGKKILSHKKEKEENPFNLKSCCFIPQNLRC